MSHHWLLLSIFLTIFLLQISYLHSISINSDINNHIIDENYDNQNIKNILLHLIKNTLNESNPYKQTILLNQLREYLNRMCVFGLFGSSRAHACQNVVDIINQLDRNDENNVTFNDDNTNNENHDIQKRFFCNGFIGCKHSG
ncbi:unnamed protein product [Rotaria sordida]|uniref:Uncharacterized protein n=1 Tax=Rotaria sordida TaxID=392033 RepID=A0A819YSH3_9BILA|nr:unnamed protein product [Rotaria sordida]CAF1072052.1 unnamed protein product [Rotaria sordida]CAF1115504.1 unnamed protein product [Rotaria sordida]CAF1182301.1 unnamed protein product [Rotaria sordida]CAF3862834.1 unnamed protein product [Rotaria sordida]